MHRNPNTTPSANASLSDLVERPLARALYWCLMSAPWIGAKDFRIDYTKQEAYPINQFSEETETIRE